MWNLTSYILNQDCLILVVRVQEGKYTQHPIHDYILKALIIIGFMGIDKISSLGMPSNCTYPEYFEHVSSIFLFSLMACTHHCPL